MQAQALTTSTLNEATVVPAERKVAAASTSADSRPKTEHAKDASVYESKIMIVDDESYNILVVRKYLQDNGYKNCVATSDSSAAMELIRRHRPDVVLLDVMMPGVSGLEILQAMRAEPETEHLPVLILTAATDSETKQNALDLGATDFLPKPVDPNELVPRVRNVLVAKAYQDRLADQAEYLDQQIRRRTAELAASRHEVVHCLARAAEFRDDTTGLHVVRVGKFAGIIARELGFRESHVELLELAAQLHDVGKIGIPDSILKCPGKLDPEQFDLMKTHCAIAKSILRPLSDEEWMKAKAHAGLGGDLLRVRSSPLLMMAARIAQTHHEWWDGTGYPLGLAGEDIPIEGRMTAVADVFDALSTARPYKPPIPREECYAMMSEQRGTHFDPRVLDAFFARANEVVQVQIEMMDTV
jgi:putative two-component system response regulator